MTIIPFSKNEIAPGLASLANTPRHPSVSEVAISTGWWELDQIFKLYPGQFTVITGIPGSGKSTFAMNLMVNLAKANGLRSMVYGPENESDIHEKLERIWGDKPGFDKFCSDQCWVQSNMTDAYDSPAQTLHWVLHQAEAAIKHAGVDLLVIDPWNELEWARERQQPMTDYIAECLKLLKYFTRLHDVAVIVVAHPTKDVGKDGKARTLTLYDIEGSAHWYNKSDNGLIVVRDPNSRTTKVVSAKVRKKGAGKLGFCYFDVDPETEVFTPQHGAAST